MYKAVSIILGIMIIYLVSFLLIWSFSSLYFLLAKRGSKGWKKNFLHSVVLAFINALVVLLVVAFFSMNKYFFTTLSFAVFAGSYFLFYKYVWKLEKLDSLILAFGMAFILNPAWLMFLRII